MIVRNSVIKLFIILCLILYSGERLSAQYYEYDIKNLKVNVVS